MRDPFEFDDYFTQDYNATIEKMEFMVSEQYGNLQAVLTNKYDEPIHGNDGEMRTDRPEYFSIGNADLWQPTNHGQAFTSADGNYDKRIKSNSAFGVLVIRIVDLVGQSDILARAGDTGDLNPLYCSATYEGLRFHWVTEGAGVPWENKKTGKSGITKGSQLPQELLDGTDRVAGALNGQVFDVNSLDLSPELLADLTTSAKGHSIGEFQSFGISLLRDLHDDEAYGKLSAALSEIGFYETLRAS